MAEGHLYKAQGGFIMYSMRDLSTILNKSPQALYKLIKQNQSLSTIINENSEKNGRFIKYGEPVLSWLVDYYGISLNQEGEKEAPEAPVIVPAVIDVKVYEDKINALESQIQALTASLGDKDKEISYFKEQNAQLLLLLQLEKQEKALLLSAPKKSIKDKIRTLFMKSKEPPEA